jgi:aspartate aminotransferase
MPLSLSQRVNEIAPSGSIQIASLISKLRREGQDIIGLNIGEPDFPAPPQVVAATAKAMKSGYTKYSLVAGEINLREKIAQVTNEVEKTNITKDNILVGNGSKQIIYNAFQAILNPGDEVIVPIPYWVTIPESVKLAGGVVKLVNCREDFTLDLEEIKKAVTNKTKAIYINTPNNPTGVVYSAKQIKELYEIARESDLYIVSDEAYEALSYDSELTTPYSINKDAFERTITIRSFSKTYCMTGFRLGYMIASESFISMVEKFQGHLCGNIPPFTQHGAVEALNNRSKILDPLYKEMKERRDLSYELFKQIFPCHKPQGAFYLFLDISPYIEAGIVKDDIEMVQYLIEKANVAFVPGSAFGLGGHIRLSYTATKKELKEAANRVSEVLKH